jgi:arylsulfatase
MNTGNGNDNKQRPSRRNILLGGTTLAAASAVGGATPIQVAQAQAQQAPAGQRPNILVIWGDDVGVANVSAYRSASWGSKRQTSTASPARA